MEQPQSPQFDDKQIPILKSYLNKLVELGGSDLHLKALGRPYARVHGEMNAISDDVLGRDEMMTLAKEMLRSRFTEFVQQKEIDLTFRLSDEYRFRVNMFFQKDGVGMVFRTIPVKIMTVEDLKLPESVKGFKDAQRGLILVTGVTGSGKSTTLAAIIDLINSNRKKHIITIEDPIEFIHKDKLSVINQRSIGEDTLSFSNALRSALREDPDVILVGEMRDLETVEIALHAAETGHLVLSTLHTADTKETINRIVGMFPTNEQNRIRGALSSVLHGVLSQRLVRTKDGKRRAAVEILLKTPRIADMIRENRDGEIKDALAEGKEVYGTQTFDQALLDLYYDGVISEDEAVRNATSPDNLKLVIHGVTGVGEKARGNKLDSEKEETQIKLKI
jgi:twitching motility protein PilT